MSVSPRRRMHRPPGRLKHARKRTMNNNPIDVWPVFPIAPRGKNPLTAHGFKDATKDPKQVELWQTEYPECNWAIPTGAGSGVVVLDIDPRHGGDKELERLIATYGELPFTVECWTGGGGRHFYFTHPGGVIPSSSSKVGAGVDVKGDGGYVVIPPSIHECGNEYEWDLEHHPRRTPLAPIPTWLQDRIHASM